MKDCAGQELAVGDVIAYAQQNYLKIGVISRFTPKNAVVVCKRYRESDPSPKYIPSGQMFRVEDNQALQVLMSR